MWIVHKYGIFKTDIATIYSRNHIPIIEFEKYQNPRGHYLQRPPGCFVAEADNTTEAGHDARLPFFQKVRLQKEETPWLLTSPVSFSPALHIGQLWEEQLI